MHRIPKDIDLGQVLGHFTPQMRVGQFDLQFSFGPVDFAVESPIDVLRGSEIAAHWEQGKWPDRGFYDIMNAAVVRCDVVSDRLIEIEFENGLVMKLQDSSDQYESMSIAIRGESKRWII